MLQVFNVPYPYAYPKTGLLPFYLPRAMLTLGAVELWRLSGDKLSQFSLPARCLFVFLLLAALREQFIRTPVMQGVTNTAYVYSFVANIPALVPLAVTACLIVLITPRLTQPW